MLKKNYLLILLSFMLVASMSLACSKASNDDPKKDPPIAQPGDPKTPKDEGPVAGEDEEGWIRATDKSKIPAASKNRTDMVIVGMNETQGIFNPVFSSTVYDRYVNDVLFNSLLEIGLDGAYIESVAKSWDISDDGLTYTFHLRDDVKYSDGTPLTAEDVAFTFHVYLDPNYDGQADLSKAVIKGADAYKNGNAEAIEGITVVNDHEITIEVEESRATTLGLLAISVLPKHYYGEGYSKGNLSSLQSLHQKPLGSGPYVFDRYIPGQEVRVVANADYWKGAPKIKNLIFKSTTSETDIQMIQTGETDFEEGISVTRDNVELLKSFGFVDMSLLPNNGYGYIAFNHALPKFQDKRVRQALTYGLNREDIVYAVFQEYADVINVPQSKLSWSYPDESELNQYEFNLEKAKELLDEAGWEMGSDGYRYKDGEKFVIYFAATSPNVVNDAIIPYATENYKELGIEFIPEQLEFNAVVQKRQSGDFDMLFLAWGLSNEPDPTNLFHTNGSQNDDSYSNAKADELMEAGLKELDQEKRAEIYHELYKELNEDLPYIFMYQRYNMNTINARLQGFDISPYRFFTESLYLVEME